MILATLVKRGLKGFSGDARLYRLSEKISYGWDYDTEESKGDTDHVIVSAAVVMMSGPETYIFPSNENGDIVDWGELNGSFKGELNHSMAIDYAGWELA